jgi:hypothetical protein
VHALGDALPALRLRVGVDPGRVHPAVALLRGRRRLGDQEPGVGALDVVLAQGVVGDPPPPPARARVRGARTTRFARSRSPSRQGWSRGIRSSTMGQVREWVRERGHAGPRERRCRPNRGLRDRPGEQFLRAADERDGRAGPPSRPGRPAPRASGPAPRASGPAPRASWPAPRAS